MEINTMKKSKHNIKVSHAKQSINGETFLEINIDDIKDNPMQPRIHIDENQLKGLMRSIELQGLIQPIAVIKIGENQYILKAGQRRLLAHKRLELKKIKAIVQEEVIVPTKESKKALFEIAVLENTQRENLHPLELALSLRQAMDKGLYKNYDELAAALSKSKSYVSKVMKILSLDDEILEDLRNNKSVNDIEVLYEIQKIEDSNEQIKIYHDFSNKKLDRNDIRELNKKESSKVKTYKFENRAKKIKLHIDVSKLTDNEINKMTTEIKDVLSQYI